MNRKISLGICIATLMLLSACSSSPVFRDPHANNESLVIAYIDMSEADSESTWMRAKIIKKRGEKPGWYHFGFVRDDKLGPIMHNQYVEPSTLKLDGFGGDATGFFDNAYYEYSFPAQGRGMGTLTVKKQGVYFAGAFKYKKVETGFFEAGKFNIEPTDSPSEKEVLQAFLKHVEDGKWKKMIQTRIRELE